MRRFFCYLASTFLFITSLSAFSQEWIYIVNKGDSLWNISEKYLTNVNYYDALQKLNNIKHPKRLQPNSVIRVPLKWISIKPAAVSVKHFSGSVKLKRANSVAQVNTHTQILLGDEVHIDQNAYVTFEFADNTQMTLSDTSILVFDHLTEYGKTGMVDTRIRLNEGKVEVRAAKANGPGSRLDIKTASAITSVKGTVFRVSNSDNENKSNIEVIEGKVAVSADTAYTDITAGFGLSVKEGAKLAKPVKLLAAPTFTTNNNILIERPKFPISWRSLDGATQYRIQIAGDALFSNILHDSMTSSTEFQLPKLDDGTSHIRVTAFDKNELEGMPANLAINLNLEPAISLVSSSKTVHTNRKFNTSSFLDWKLTTEAEHYIVEFSTDATFNSLSYSQTVNTPSELDVSNLANKTYFWRVTGVDKHGKGPSSVVDSFSATHFLPTPVIEVNASTQNSSSKQLDVSWLPIPEGYQIEIQTAYDEEFNSPISKTMSIATKTFSAPLSDKHTTYVRARIVSNEQATSEWSEIKQISNKHYGYELFWSILAIVLVL